MTHELSDHDRETPVLDAVLDRANAECSRLSRAPRRHVTVQVLAGEVDAVAAEVRAVMEARDEAEREVERLRATLASMQDQAWFGAWRCGCSDTERAPIDIPEFCPLHGRSLISNSAGQTKVRLNHSGVSGYGFHRGPQAEVTNA